jgi:hypothetical protein
MLLRHPDSPSDWQPEDVLTGGGLSDGFCGREIIRHGHETPANASCIVPSKEDFGAVRISTPDLLSRVAGATDLSVSQQIGFEAKGSLRTARVVTSEGLFLDMGDMPTIRRVSSRPFHRRQNESIAHLRLSSLSNGSFLLQAGQGHKYWLVSGERALRDDILARILPSLG